jgi:hypothetical protein
MNACTFQRKADKTVALLKSQSGARSWVHFSYEINRLKTSGYFTYHNI